MTERKQTSRAKKASVSRRGFLKVGGAAAAGAALSSMQVPRVHAAEDNTIRLAIIGCGGRGRGAVANALSVPDSGPIELYAAADLFAEKIDATVKILANKFGDRINVPPERRFAGFDAYKKAIGCLRPGSGDVVLLTTRSYCRPTHFVYAVEQGVNVFMEKSFASDPGGSHRMLKAGKIAEQKGLKVAAGLQCRHSVNRQALIKRIEDGELGEIQLIRAARLGGGRRMGPFPGNENELLWQIKNRGFFLWASSGVFSELLIHQVDECCWLKNSWPIAAHGLGGRAPNNDSCGQNLDTYSIEYTFADGTKALVTNRNIRGCHNEFATFVHGTKCAAQFSGQVHRGTVRKYRDQRIANDNIVWEAPNEQFSPWQAEWNDLIASIRNDLYHNETERALKSNLTTIMGRAAVHSGRIITWDEVISSNFFFCDYVDEMTETSPPPVKADAEGRYPAPIPGQWTEI